MLAFDWVEIKGPVKVSTWACNGVTVFGAHYLSVGNLGGIDVKGIRIKERSDLRDPNEVCLVSDEHRF